MTGLWLQLAISTLVILGGAHFLTRAADVIAERTGLGHSFIGVILLSTATSLPELGTGLSSIVLLHEPDLAAGAVFGSNLFNLLILALLDLYWRQGPILWATSDTSKLIAWLGIAVIGVSTAAVWLHHVTPAMNSWYLAPSTWVLFAVFLLAMHLIYQRERSLPAVETADKVAHPEGMWSLRRAVLAYAGSAAVVIGGAVWLSRTGEGLVQAYGWDASFVGTQFLALCTSLPEVATSVAAVRLGAVDLAVTNVLGSNLFNMGFILCANDLAWREGSIWSAVSAIHLQTGLLAIGMTGIVLVGLYSRRRPRRAGPVPRASYTITVLIVAAYAVASYLVYRAG